jgi:dienelactone hydrolase
MGASTRRPGPFFAAILIAAAAIGAAFYFKPMPALEDKSLLKADASVRVESGPAGLAFIPAGAAKSSGLVFYCGARVPPEAYAYLARACAQSGYTAVLASMPLNFAIFAPAKAAKAAAAYPSVARWVLAGHSLGGTAAASYAARNAKAERPVEVAGLLLYASYPGPGGDLSTYTLPVVTVGATRDALATPAKIAAARDRLPGGSRYVEIAGGNHAQFGEYGPQPGDGLAEIPGSTQRRAAIEEAIALLDRVDAGAGK